MAEGFDASSFEFYEGIRILIPGALAVGLTDAIVSTAHPDGHGLGLTTLTTVVATVVVGLLLYFVDLPAKSPYYTTDMPTSAMAGWGRTKNGEKLSSLYFVLLDTEVPPGIKARALYMGSIYRIGYEAICLIAVASTFVLSQPLWTTKSIQFELDQVPHDVYIGTVAMLALVVMAFLGDMKAKKRREGEQRAEGKPTGPDAKDLWVIGIISTVFAGLLVAANVVAVPRCVILAPTLAGFACWFFRYYKGYAKSPTVNEQRAALRLRSVLKTSWRTITSNPWDRSPASAFRASLLLATAEISILLSNAGWSNHHGWVGRYELSAWVAADIVALALVVARGHERQLGGAYTTQRAWLRLERESLTEKYFEVVDDA